MTKTLADKRNSFYAIVFTSVFILYCIGRYVFHRNVTSVAYYQLTGFKFIVPRRKSFSLKIPKVARRAPVNVARRGVNNILFRRYTNQVGLLEEYYDLFRVGRPTIMLL